jgi:SAM-dependent methyltransferase
MQAYSAAFARVYNQQWGGFARHIAPRLLDFYAGTPHGQARQPVLDLCCGTGQLALAFLDAGYPVTGLDLSEAMLSFAAQNAAEHVIAGRARFVHGDAASFTLDERFGLVISTYDALNHLPSLDALRRCFASVRAVLLPGGHFIFDLNTRLGLRRWNTIHIDDSDEAVVIQRGVFDGEGDRAWVKISGFIRVKDGRYERFDEVVYNTVFALADVLGALGQAGFAAHPARADNLAAPLADPEAEGRVFFVSL